MSAAQVWEEMRAGAERNKRAAAEVQQGGGLAAFLGVPSESQDGGKPAADAPARYVSAWESMHLRWPRHQGECMCLKD
eukprot:1157850-Pelagomonas_calceolata.AAC.3